METVHEYSKAYHDLFNPTAYLSMSMGSLSEEDPMGGLFGGQVLLGNEQMRTGKIQGKTLVEVGCGPSILFSIVPSMYFENVYLADYLDRNVQIIQTWLDDKPEQVDSQPFFDFASKHLGKGVCCPEALRKKICGVFQCDVNDPEVLPSGVSPRTFDCVTSSLVLPGACANDDELNKAVSNLASLLNCGGTLITYIVLESTFVKIGGKTLRDLPISDESMSFALKEAGLHVISKRIEKSRFDKSQCNAKYYGLYIAKKKNY